MANFSKRQIAAVIGSFPPPLHGASAINQNLLEQLRARHVPAEKINLSPDRMRWWGYHLTRFLRVGAAVIHILCSPGKTDLRYVMSVDGGAGLWYNIILAAALRLRRRELLLYHHSSSYICAESRAMWLLLRVAGAHVPHAMCSVRMFDIFRQRYEVRSAGLIVNNAAWIPLQPAQMSPRSDRIRLGHLSGLTEEKGLGRAIETLRELQRRGVPAELILAGSPLDAAAHSMLALAQSEFGDQLRYLGVVTGPPKLSFYAGIDYFLFPSLYRHETQSLVVPEALAAGIPVIAHDHRFVGEVVGDAGLLVPAGSSFAKSAVDWILSGHLDERRAAARAQLERLRQDAFGQINLILNWAGGVVDDEAAREAG